MGISVHTAETEMAKTPYYTIRWRLSIPLFRKPIAWRRAHAMARRLRDPTTPSREASLARAQTAPDRLKKSNVAP